MLLEPRPRHWDRLITAAAECLRAPPGASLDSEPVGNLCSAAEYLLTDAFRALPRTRRLWVDGILPSFLELAAGNLVVLGQAWCADSNNQWLVPIQLEVRLTTDGADTATLRVGDATFASLDEHRTKRAKQPQAAWLHTFELSQARALPVELAPLLERLRAWVDAHPGDTAVVDPDWRYLTPAEAEAFLRDCAERGHVAFEETWLHGREALRIQDGSSQERSRDPRGGQ